MKIVIRPTGQTTMLVHDELQGFIAMGEDVSQRRASHVEPVNLPLRILFRLIRWMTGETGKISDWTRGWPCQWRADMRPSGGPILKACYLDRKEAIQAEIEWLMKNNYGVRS